MNRAANIRHNGSRRRALGVTSFALIISLLLIGCGAQDDAVQLSSGDDAAAANEVSEPASPEGGAHAGTGDTEQRAEESARRNEADDTAAPGLSTRRPVDGFDVAPPGGFAPVEEYPLHGSQYLMDGQQVGVRMYHNSESNETVLVAVWEAGAAGLAEQLGRYGDHTGDVRPGRQVDGTVETWELREAANSGLPTRTNLAATLPDGSMIWLSGTDVEDVDVLYEMLLATEDAPGSLEPLDGDPGEAVPGGIRG